MALQQLKQQIETFLATQLTDNPVTQLTHAMRYSLLNPAKRLRPLLVYSVGALGVPTSHLNGIAGAIECIHTYSLIHDDLPAMDDDDLRRGLPACHKKFTEATAILAGDALQTLAFSWLSNEKLTPFSATCRLKLIQILSHYIGHQGLILGQALDLEAENKILSVDQITDVHLLKTGSLFAACSEMAAQAAQDYLQVDLSESFKILQKFNHHFGLAFQIQDDVLDVIADTVTLGKPAHSDVKNNKATFVSILGLSAARELATYHWQAAMQTITDLEMTNKLSDFQLLKMLVSSQLKIESMATVSA